MSGSAKTSACCDRRRCSDLDTATLRDHLASPQFTSNIGKSPGIVRIARVYGSTADGSDTAGNDIDLMIVSDTFTYPEITAALHPLIERTGREINSTLYTRAELRKRSDASQGFAARVSGQLKLWLWGDPSSLPPI